MAAGDQTITYPIIRPRISQGVRGSSIIYKETVLNGPGRVGQAGVFTFRYDYVETDYDPDDPYVFHTILPDLYLALEYADYDGGGLRRIYLQQGELYAPPDIRGTFFTRTFAVGEGWRAIELAGQVFGREYDPSPYGAVVNGALRLYNGATFAVQPLSQTYQPTKASERNATGVDGVDFVVQGLDSYFRVTISSADAVIILPETVFPTDDIISGVLFDTPDFQFPPRTQRAPSASMRIWQVYVEGVARARHGSYSNTWYFGTPPIDTPSTGGGGTAVDHGGTGTDTIVADGGQLGPLRAAQSGMHQWFARGGLATALFSTAGSQTSAPPASSSNEGPIG